MSHNFLSILNDLHPRFLANIMHTEGLLAYYSSGSREALANPDILAVALANPWVEHTASHVDIVAEVRPNPAEH